MPQKSADLTHARLTVPKAALREAIKSIPQKTRRKTKEVENLGAAVAKNPTADCSLVLSEAVCDWASMGQRVWVNLNKRNPNDLGDKICKWFQVANKTRDAGEAIKCGVAIKGLGVSFASKHLRILSPQRFAVLDSVLSRELGFALNIAGYKLFMQALHDYQRRYFPEHNVGTLEMGIYWFVQQKKGAR